MKVYNPILSGFHADPSILCANGEYVIANSTFEWFPGVELHKSKDLKTWECVPSPLSTTKLLDMKGEDPSCGIWAPCLSFCNGVYYLIYTNVASWCSGPWKDCPNYLTTAASLEGPWSDPVFLNASGFDASMFHDDDGKHWLVNMEWDYRKSGSRQFSGILVQEYDAVQKKLVGDVHKVFLGTDIGLVEGPHIYKREGLYYLAAAEGGTCYEHAETVARSKNLFGPYEVHPANPLISSYGHDEVPLKRAGHGSWCESIDGKKTYFVYLCGRPLPGTENCVLGRETGIAEIEWKDGWPWIKQPDGSLKNTPPDYIELPGSGEQLPGKGVMHTTEKYTFNNNDFLKEFKTLRVPIDSRMINITERPGYLRMHGSQSPVSKINQSLIARRQTGFKFTAETKMDFNPENFQQFAGMVYRYDERTQYICSVTRDENRGKIIQIISIDYEDVKINQEISIEDNKSIYIRLEVDGLKGQFHYSLDGKNWRTIRPLVETRILSDEYKMQGFTGAFVGMYCADLVSYSNYCDFEYFIYKD